MQIYIYKCKDDSEKETIINQKTTEGLKLVSVLNVVEGIFVGFAEDTVPEFKPLETKVDEIQTTLDLLFLKQEGIL